MIMWSSWFCHWLTFLFYCIWWDRMNYLNIIVIRLCILELCCQPWIRFRGLHFSRKEPINFAISPTCQPYWEILPSIKVLAFAHKHNGVKKIPMDAPLLQKSINFTIFHWTKCSMNYLDHIYVVKSELVEILMLLKNDFTPFCFHSLTSLAPFMGIRQADVILAIAL